MRVRYFIRKCNTIINNRHTEAKPKYLFLRIYPRFFATLRMTQGVHFLCEGFARGNPVFIQLPLKFWSTEVDPTSLLLTSFATSLLTLPKIKKNTEKMGFCVVVCESLKLEQLQPRMQR